MNARVEIEFDDEAMWRRIAARIRAWREAELAAVQKHNEAIDWSWLSSRCPHCQASWDMFPPARIHDGNGNQTGDVRCVECKNIYSSLTIRYHIITGDLS